MDNQEVKNYLYSLLKEDEKTFLSEWLKNDKKIPHSKQGEPYSYITAKDTKIIVCSAVTNL